MPRCVKVDNMDVRKCKNAILMRIRGAPRVYNKDSLLI